MSSDVRDSLIQLNKKDLLEIANLGGIHIPKDWSKSLMVELLALNVSMDIIHTSLLNFKIHLNSFTAHS